MNNIEEIMDVLEKVELGSVGIDIIHRDHFKYLATEISQLNNAGECKLNSHDIEIIEEHRDLMDDIINGDYTPDSLTNQPINGLIGRLSSYDKDEWIHVDDRLPDVPDHDFDMRSSEAVYIYGKYDHCIGFYQVYKGIKSWVKLEKTQDIEIKDVTHWKMPQPPKTKEGS